MDGPSVPDPIPRVVRQGQCTSLRSDWMALAYERLHPALHARTGPPPGQSGGREPEALWNDLAGRLATPPRAATGD